jgi:chorismate-pyruvate lyase
MKVSILVCVLTLGAGAAPLRAADVIEARSAWPDTWVARLEALALLESFHAGLLSHDSATESLQSWCAAHALAVPANITATRMNSTEKPASAEVRHQLGVSPTEPVRYRRVELHCGHRVLSEADNWYVPARLTADMNRILENTDTPFGRAVQDLHFRRRTLSSTLLWAPLAEGWESRPAADPPGAGALVIPHEVLRTTAVLMRPDGSAFSEVVETYTAELLAFTPPALPR